MRLQLLLIIPQIMYTIAQLSVQSHQYQKLMEVYFAYLQRHHYKGINNQMFEPFQFHFVNEGNAGAVYAFKDSSFPDGLAIKVSYYMMGEVCIYLFFFWVACNSFKIIYEIITIGFQQ